MHRSRLAEFRDGIRLKQPNIPVKMNFERTALTLSILMFLLGFMLLCNCPGWYVTSALFAALAVWKGRGTFRVYSLMLMGAALLIALAHAVAEYK